jgi:pimeloyl-ACP methyl ester carboxylesterase
MDWAELEEVLIGGARRARGFGTVEKEMREYFGDEEYRALQDLVEKTKSIRSRGPLLGNVVFLPGIMGSNLVALANGVKENLIWINFIRLVFGGLEQLKLTPDGRRDADRAIHVRTSTIDKRTYARAILTLRGRWDVQPFAYDWRKDIDEASHALAAFIRRKFSDQPVHLVAHSMGGLVCRNFIRLHTDLWRSMRDENDKGGLLIMLGTPNYGSYAIHQALSGEEKCVRLLAGADRRHNMSEILRITNSFVGSYQLLPWSPQLDDKTTGLYHADTWGSIPVSQVHLGTARDFHRVLDDESTIDPERMRYIAGCNQRTLSDLEVIEPGKFEYMTSFEGDGCVPFRLGLLKGVPTYYVEEDHRGLPGNEKVLAAIEQLLETGRTTMLFANPVRGRAGMAGEKRWSRTAQDYRLESDIGRIALAAQNLRSQVTSRELRLAEETLTRVAVGGSKSGPIHPEKVPRATSVRTKPRTSIGVAWGDVTKAKAPVVVVGHYKGVTPVNAIGAIDHRLHHWIRDAAKYSMIGGELGQLFFVPVRNKEIAAEAVLVAGMGLEGTFDRHDLRYLMMNVTLAISRLGVDQFTTVLIGAGEGNLETEHALRAIVSGIAAALERLQGQPAVKKILVVELFARRAKDIRKLLGDILSSEPLPGVAFDKAEYKFPGGKREETRAILPEEKAAKPLAFGPRITIEREGDIFRFSALTTRAIVPVREVEIQAFFQGGIASRLAESSTADDQVKLGRTLHAILVPEDFQQYYDVNEPLTLILDRNTAWLPWEMACFERPGGNGFFGTDLQVTRQFRTLLSSTPGIVPRDESQLRVLVIADPAQEPELQLRGARKEGEQIVQLLNNISHACGRTIEVVQRIGSSECDPVEILTLLLSEEFDVVHYAGHGIFDDQKPSHGGWIFGFEKGATDKFQTLSAREIFRTRHIPRLVFSNACFSSVVNRGKAFSAEETNRRLAGLAEAFFERGVQDYIGAGWPVQDDLAIRFATEFYARALTGKPAEYFARESPRLTDGNPKLTDLQSCIPYTLGKALEEARKTILFQGSTWGAYQHYGQASAQLLKEPTSTVEPGRKKRRK